MSTVVNVLSYATLFLNIAMLAGAVFYAANRFFDFKPSFIDTIEDYLYNYYRELSFFLASVATAGSLYVSNILGWTPCRLCWFQRILMYPLVVVLGVGILFNDENSRDYALPLAMIGLPISIYHTLLQRYDHFESAGCSVTSVSCEATDIAFHFGYITLPVMAATVFIGILILMWRFNERQD